MSSLKLSLLLSLIFILNGCSQVQPFEDRRREPGSEQIYVGASTPDHPAICYNPLFYKLTEIQPLADTLCSSYKAGSIAVYQDKDIFSCRLFVPSKAYYECVKKE